MDVEESHLWLDSCYLVAGRPDIIPAHFDGPSQANNGAADDFQLGQRLRQYIIAIECHCQRHCRHGRRRKRFRFATVTVRSGLDADLRHRLLVHQFLLPLHCHVGHLFASLLLRQDARSEYQGYDPTGDFGPIRGRQ